MFLKILRIKEIVVPKAGIEIVRTICSKRRNGILRREAFPRGPGASAARPRAALPGWGIRPGRAALPGSAALPGDTAACSGAPPVPFTPVQPHRKQCIAGKEDRRQNTNHSEV